MLTENGFDEALKLLNIPIAQKEFLSTKSFEVQKIVKKIKETPKPENYNPFDKEKKVVKITKETSLRSRGFRQAVIEVYGCKCAVCGLKINSPDNLLWEVEAAHIVPYSSKGKDDIWNGLSLCRLHHWAFDVGWFSLENNFRIISSSKIQSLQNGFGKLNGYDFLSHLTSKNLFVMLPDSENNHPHISAIGWHRENIFYK
jgi:putative restriction endonuclease